ncbi:hypothetical protein J2S00_001005 [Caldalkalibacillus uzonensis]|uniref:RES domain-containing protein n=1 Tax=Caldalkalibacillus uzonensis TaxID=353224 RepID=A0ABU0CQQ0_9BACI|nr:hypothetical protein [Caldalkalibacillus uzonensis]MDQ0338221.1 hypothetical protein [Caldalkalibacillus uzonensis]
MTKLERIVYRGVDLEEAYKVIREQSYDQRERRVFQDGVHAKAVFGNGVYLVSNILVAAEYAFCHAETSRSKGAILKQKLRLRNPIVLDETFGERELRQEALKWKYPDGEIEVLYPQGSSLQLVEWTGNIIREYLLSKGYDGIVYHLNDDLTYYVAYDCKNQIYDVELEFVFDIEQFLKSSKKFSREN